MFLITDTSRAAYDEAVNKHRQLQFTCQPCLLEDVAMEMDEMEDDTMETENSTLTTHTSQTITVN